jgi:hypothetical protein
MISITSMSDLHAAGIRGRWTTASEEDVRREIARLESRRDELCALYDEDVRRHGRPPVPAVGTDYLHIAARGTPAETQCRLGHELREIDIDLDSLHQILAAHRA